MEHGCTSISIRIPERGPIGSTAGLECVHLASIPNAPRRARFCREVFGIGIASLILGVLVAATASAAPFAYITNRGSDDITVIDVATSAAVATIPSAGGNFSNYGVAVHPGGTRVYVTHNGTGNAVSIVDTATNTRTGAITVAADPLGIAINPAGTRAYVTHNLGTTVTVLDTVANSVLGTITVAANPTGVAITPDGARAYVTHSPGNTVTVISTVTDTVLTTISVGTDPFGIAVNPTGTRVYVTHTNTGDVRVINTVTNAVIANVTGGNTPYGVAVTPDGSKVYQSDSGANTVRVIDTATNTVTATVNVGSSPQGIAVTPDGTRVYAVNQAGNNVSVIDTTSNSVVATVPVGSGPRAFGLFIGGPAPGAPAISVTGTTTFPATTVGGSSGVQPITITNSGTANLSIASISHSGAALFPDTTSGPPPNAAHYCGFGSTAGGAPQTGGPIMLAPAAFCTLNLIYAATATGAQTATITVNSNAPTSPTTINLSGTGAAPTATMAPAAIAFGNVPITLPVNQTGTFTNSSSTPYTLTAFANSDARFTVTGNGASPCNVGTVVNGGASCTYQATFTPTGTGSYNNTLTISFTSGGVATVFSLSQNSNGTGYLLPFTQAPASISFGNVPRSLPVSQTYTFTNMSNSTPFPTSYTINSFNVSGLGFTAVGSGGTPCNIGTVLAPTASCTVSATITATGPGSTNGTVDIGFLGSLGANPQYTASLSLNANGYDLPFTLAPGSVSFGSVPVGLPVNQNFTFTNTSNSTPFPTSYTINSFTVGGLGFTAVGSGATPCNNGAVIAPGASCTVTATITATGTGSTNGTVSIGFLGGLGSNPQYTATENLNAIGVNVAPIITSGAPPGGFVGTPYSFNFAANGSAPITWTIATGTLPNGLTLSSAGLLSGTPTLAGTFNFTVQAANGTLPNATQAQTISVVTTCGNTEVTNTNDSGACSLRAAITYANGNCLGAQTVTFNIPGAGPHLIQPLGPLPPVSCNNTTIDGYSQPGSVVNTAATGQTNADIRVQLDGALQSGGSALEFPLGVNGVIRGLSITNFSTGILAYTGVNIRGNFIGVLPDGVTPAKNGVGVSAGPNAFGGHCCIQVGGVAAADVNLVASTGDAVQYLGNVSGQVVNNLFGVNRTGSRVPGLGSSQGVASYLSAPFNANNLQVRGNTFAHQNSVVSSQGANVLFSRNSAVLSNAQRSSTTVLYSEIEITRVLYDAAGSTTIDGNINAKGASTHRIEIFSNPTPFGLAQTETYVADIDVTPTGVGLFPFSQTFPSILSIPSATVTFLANNETFVPVEYRKPVTVAAAPTPFTVVAGAPAVSQALTLTNISGGPFTFAAAPAVATGAGFAVNGGTCAGNTIGAAATCTVILEFSSLVATTAFGSVDITVTGVGQGTTNYTLPVDTVYRFALSGTATAPVGPVFTPSTMSLTFAAQSVATTSAAQTLTITNTGTAVMSIPAPSVSGPFAISANTCTGLAPAGSCTMSVTFTPTVAGAASGTLSISTNAPGSPHAISLGGTGVLAGAPTLTVAFSPSSVSTSTNATMTLTLSNPNASPAIISIGGTVSVPSLAMSSLVDGCGASASIGTGSIDLGMAGSIPALGSCTIAVQVQSATAGSFPVTVNPGNLVTSFGNNTNTSTATLTVNAVATGPFAYIPIFTSFSGSTVSVIDLPTNTLATTITVGAGPVGAAVNYAGTRVYISNQQSNSISVIDTASNTVVATVGVGSQPGSAAVNPAGTRVYVPNQSSASVSVIDATTNSVIATITGLSTPVATAVHPSGAKAYVALNSSNALGVIDAATNTLSASIPVCSAPYQPVVNGAGTRVYVVCTSGSVSVVDTGTASVIATIPVGTNARGIALTGNGAQAWVTNTGSNNVSVIDTATNTVTATLMAGSSPWGVAGNAAGTRMYVANNASNSVTVFDTGSNGIVATVPVGVGPLAVGQFVQPAAVVATPALALTPSTLAFGVRTVNTTSPLQVVTLSNSGTAPLVISSITGSGDFAFTTTCPISTPPIAPAGTCTVSISFTPLTAAALSGGITIASNAPGSPHVIGLSGTGAAVGVTNIALSPTSLDFGTVTIATASQPFAVTVSNTGFANLLLSGITTSGPFARTSRPSVPPDCGSSVAPGAACSISLVFTPAVPGAASGQLSITHNASGSPSLVSLTGLATAVPVPVLSVAPRVVFADQIINTATSLALNLSNTGTATLNIGSIALSGSSDFTQSGTCRVVAAGGSCVIDLGFRPSSIGPRAAQLDITSNTGSQSAAAAVSTAIAISGNGILAPRPAAEVSLTAVGFGNAIFGGATTSQLVKLKSVGSSPLEVRNIFTSGADFVQMNSCAGSLPTDASCLISVAFSPLGMGAKSGELQMVTNAIDSPHKVQLSGTGCRWFSQTASRFFITSCGN